MTNKVDDVFNRDFHHFVTQDPDNPNIAPTTPPSKRFELNPTKKSDKAKLDQKKERPFS